jgi:hypothetical protein
MLGLGEEKGDDTNVSNFVLEKFKDNFSKKFTDKVVVDESIAMILSILDTFAVKYELTSPFVVVKNLMSGRSIPVPKLTLLTGDTPEDVLDTAIQITEKEFRYILDQELPKVGERATDTLRMYVNWLVSSLLNGVEHDDDSVKDVVLFESIESIKAAVAEYVENLGLAIVQAKVFPDPTSNGGYFVEFYKVVDGVENFLTVSNYKEFEKGMVNALEILCEEHADVVKATLEDQFTVIGGNINLFGLLLLKIISKVLGTVRLDKELPKILTTKRRYKNQISNAIEILVSPTKRDEFMSKVSCLAGDYWDSGPLETEDLEEVLNVFKEMCADDKKRKRDSSAAAALIELSSSTQITIGPARLDLTDTLMTVILDTISCVLNCFEDDFATRLEEHDPDIVDRIAALVSPAMAGSGMISTDLVIQLMINHNKSRQ